MRLQPRREPKESKVMHYVNIIGTGMMLNLVFLMACIPVVTIGPAVCGLYSGIRFMIRGEGPVRGFWEGFKTKIGRTIPLGILMVAAAAFFVININSAYNFSQDPQMQELYGGFQLYLPLIQYAVMALPVLMLFAAMWVLNIYIDYSFMAWLKNSVNLVLKAPHWVLVTVAAMWLPVVLFFWVPGVFWAIAIVFIAAWFVVAAFGSTLVLKDALVDLKKTFLEEQEEEEE